jgi:hypothetical protein
LRFIVTNAWGAKVTDATHPPAAANLPSPPSSSEEGKESKEVGEKKEEGKEEEVGKEPKLYIRIPKRIWNEYTPEVSLVALLFLLCTFEKSYNANNA